MTDFKFDVFLSHNSCDKPHVRKLKQQLNTAGLLSWLDEEELRPGINWQPLLEDGIRCSRSIAVLIGSDGVGPWKDEEMQAALRLAVDDKRPVIPVLLPGCTQKPDLPLFLGNRTWVDMSGGFSEPLINKLIWGVTGKKPEGSFETKDSPHTYPISPSELWPAIPAVETADCYNQLQAIVARDALPQDDERKQLWLAVKRSRPCSFRDWQLANIARWCRPEYQEVEERFTPLQVNVRGSESDDAQTEKQQFAFDTLVDAMNAVFDEHMVPACIILAPPGGGKSTLLRHHQLNESQRLTECNRLVFYVQLRDYQPEKLSAQNGGEVNPALIWLESEWRKETGTAPSLREFINQGSLTLLLDGLNEIPRQSDDEYRERVAEWRELIEEIEHYHPGVCLLFACRPMDYSQRLDDGRHTRLPEIDVQAMEPERIKAFIESRFDERIASQLWEQLKNHPSLDLYSSPYYLNLLLGQTDTNAVEVSIPKNRADLFTGMVRERLRRECQKGNVRFNDTVLLGARDRKAIMNGKSSDNRLPDDTPFFEALAALAYHIQDTSGSNERWGRLRWNRACKVMEGAFNHQLPTDIYLDAGCDLGLFEDEAAQAKDIRFIHQHIQEYFAAWVLAVQPDASKLAVPWKGTDIVESTKVLLAKGGDDNLPELANTGWEESALMAAGLSEEPERFIQSLIPSNVALAGRCAAQPGLVISDRLRGDLQQVLIERSQHPAADLRARIMAANALGELGDPRLESQIRKDTKVLLPAFATIPAGDYTIGGDSEGLQQEFPARHITLPEFELACHPVTNAEFACFVQAGGYHNDAWWPGRALEWRNGEIGQEAQQQWIREKRCSILDELGQDTTAEAIRDHYKLSLAAAKWLQEEVTSPADDEFELWLKQEYPSPTKPFTKPRYWRSLTWGNSAQPVVGVCWYEARAYCLWLNTILGTGRYRLPNEAEWEAAGRRQGEWRRYAWKGDFDALRTNMAETRLGVTTPIDVFPEGNTEGSVLQDLCGNVLEWTMTPWAEGDMWNPAQEAEETGQTERRVVRGGSWHDARRSVRLGYRRNRVPDYRRSPLGFRLCRETIRDKPRFK